MGLSALERPTTHLEPTTEEPELEELEVMMFDGIVEATDGCLVEPDGWCEHGHVSWLLYYSLI